MTTGVMNAATQTLNAAQRLQTKTQRGASGYAAAWQTLAILLVAGAADMVAPLPNVVRGVIMAALVWNVVLRIRRQARQVALRREQVARAVESRHPELDNALIHAVQFGELLQANPGHPAAPLIRQELERAEREASHLAPTGIVETTPIRHQRRLFLAALIVLLSTLLLFPRVYRFEVPRLFTFWNDAPPFTLTDFIVTPAGTRVHSGESLTISVKLDGLIPSGLELITGLGGEAQQATPLLAADANHYAAHLENLTRDTYYYVRGSTGRSSRYTIYIDETPTLRRLTVVYHPPAYAKREDRRAEIGLNDEIHALTGTKVDVEVESDVPLSGGELAIESKDRPTQTIPLPVQKDAPTHATAWFIIQADGAYHVTLQSAAGGLKAPNAAQGKIVAERDEMPTVAFLTPGRDVIAAPEMTVPLKLEAEDDVAVQRVEMHRALNGKEAPMQAIPVPAPTRRFVYSDRFDLKSLSVKPGDTLEYYAVAFDKDPQGVHNSESEHYKIRVVSAEEYKRELNRQRTPEQTIAQYRALANAVRDLAEAQAQLARNMAEKAKSGAKQAETEALRKRQQELQQQAEELARQMRELAKQDTKFDVEAGLCRQIAQMQAATEKASQAMQKAISRPTLPQMAPNAQQAAQALAQAAGKPAENTERALQALEKTLPLYQDFARLKKLTTQQAVLSQQAQQIRDASKDGKPDSFAQSRLKSLSEKQTQNREEARQLQQDLKEHSQAAQSVAPDAARLGGKIAERMEKQQIGPTMQNAAQSLQNQQPKEGAEQAESASQALQSLLPPARQGQQQANKACNSQCQSALGQNAGNTLSQMAQAAGQNPANGNTPQNGQGTGSGSGESPIPVSMITAAPSGVRRASNARVTVERYTALSRENGDKPDSSPRPLAIGKDRDTSRYPVEYRRLVNDYFKSVAGK